MTTEKDHSAGLIGQTIPDVAETEARLTEAMVTDLAAKALPLVMRVIQDERYRFYESISALGEQRNGKVAKWYGDAGDAFRDAIYGVVKATIVFTSISK